jgi:hypothetical protein
MGEVLSKNLVISWVSNQKVVTLARMCSTSCRQEAEAFLPIEMTAHNI